MCPEPDKKKGAAPKKGRKAGGEAGAGPKSRGPKARAGRRLSGRTGGGPKVFECEVPGCKKETERSISYKKAKDAMEDWKLEDEGPRRIRVCKKHYKEFKKATKRDRDIDRAGWMERTGRLDGKR